LENTISSGCVRQADRHGIFNSGPSTAFVRWGTGAQTATVNDLPIASGASETFGKLTTHDTIAAISGGMATLYVSSGNRV
ncbi:MAG: hypothetical protein WCF85_21460, partial [Rhodospirillaceae bacterium]